MNKGLLIAAFALAPVLVNAADTAPAAPATPPETIAPHTCKQPDLPSSGGGHDSEASAITAAKKSKASDFGALYNAYSSCIKAYVDSQSDSSKRHITAANAAVKELNDYNAKVNEAQQ